MASLIERCMAIEPDHRPPFSQILEELNEMDPRDFVEFESHRHEKNEVLVVETHSRLSRDRGTPSQPPSGDALVIDELF